MVEQRKENSFHDEWLWLITTNKRSAFNNHVEFLGFKFVSKGPTSSKFPIPTPEAPYHPMFWKSHLIIHKHRKWVFHIQNSDSNFILINSVILTGPPCNQRTIGHGFEESSTLYGLLYSHQNMCASVTIILKKKMKFNCYFHFTLLSISTNTKYAKKLK
jgi:hypothetical protein